MGGGSNTTTQTTGSTNPEVDKTVSKLLGGLGTQFDRGTAVFDKSLYGGMSDTTKGGIGSLTARAGEGQQGLDTAFGWAQGAVNNGGYNAALTGAQGEVLDYLKSSRSNAPGYAALRQKGIDDALTGVGSSFLTDGRFGSSVMGEAAGEAAADTALGFDYQNYTDRLNRQLQGSQALAGIGQTAMGNAGAAAAALPGFATARLQPAQMQIAAGQMLDADTQARLQGENDLFRRTNDAGWSTLGQASSILNGTAGASGQQTSTTSPQAPWWQTILGMGLGAL